MFKKLLSVSGFTLLSRITGFARDILMASILGKGLLSDAFLVAFLFPNYFRQIFGEGTLNPAFLPRYAALLAKEKTVEAARFANQIFSWQMAAQLLLLVLAMVAMSPIMHVIVPGYTPSELALTVTLSRITFPYLVLTLVAIQLSGMLNAVEKFWAAAAWSNFLNLSMIAALLLSRHFPNAAYAASWGVLAGGVAQLVFMLWVGTREGLWLRLTWPRWTPDVKEFFIAFGAVTVGAASVVVAPMIDFLIASYLPVGSRTALYYADRIDQLPLGVLGIALGTVLLPQMSTLLARDDNRTASAAQNRSAALSLLLTLPFAAVFLAVPGTIMRAVFVRGHFDVHAADLAAVALAAYGVGLPAFALVRIFASTFYARHDTITPARVTVTAIAVNIALKFIFVWGAHLGIAGVALGTAFGAWLNVGLLVWLGRRRRLLTIEPQFRRAMLPVIAAGLVAGGGAWIGAHFMGRFGGGLHDLFALVGAGAVGGAAYGAVVLALRRRLPLGKLSLR